MAKSDDEEKIVKALRQMSEQQAETNKLLSEWIAMQSSAEEGQAAEGEGQGAAEPGEYIPHHAHQPVPEPGKRPPPNSLLELTAREGPKEEVLLRTALGIATIAKTADGHPYALFNAELWKLDGEWDGVVQTVIRLEVDVKHEYTFPPRQEATYDSPSDIRPASKLNQNRAKSRWTFADGSTIEAVGVAVGYRVPMKDESFQIVVALTEAITHGTHVYSGVKGLATFVGGTWFPATPAFNAGERSEHRSFQIIRLFRKPVQGPLPPL
jgi:hypothetical protein